MPLTCRCENFLYGFKGAPSAPRAVRRVTTYATWREELVLKRRRARGARGKLAAPPGGRSP